jgi:hypothetical protein
MTKHFLTVSSDTIASCFTGSDTVTTVVIRLRRVFASSDTNDRNTSQYLHLYVPKVTYLREQLVADKFPPCHLWEHRYD